MPPFIALDIETTGLDARHDAIIEIGAVRYNSKDTAETWQSLINPQCAIPAHITQLTGITGQMVAQAPPIKAVIQEFADFVGDLPIVGHNISFDLSFLEVHHAFDANPICDTFEVAAVLLPTASRYSLSALVEQLGAYNVQPHRALEDAQATRAVLLKLFEKGLQLSVHLVAEIVQASQHIQWYGSWFFSTLLKELAKAPIAAHKASGELFGVLLDEPAELLVQPLKPNAIMEPLDVEEVCALLQSGGAFDAYLDQFESRSEQIEMLRAITNALSNSQHLMVEAGTGIGKSFAYLVPAALWATRNNSRVVISTNTLNLQDQLMHKDIPDLKKALALDVRAAVLKGRSNYLCPRRLQALRHRRPRDAAELRLLAKVIIWLHEGGNGELAQLNISGPAERDSWIRISAQDETCSMEVCLSRLDGICPYFKARQSALGAHIVVVNHALLLSDVIANNRVLPDYKYLIVDEAHHLEDASTNALSYKATRADVERLFNELGGKTSGVLGGLLQQLRKLLKPSDLAAVEQAVDQAGTLAFRAENGFRTFFSAIDDFMRQERNDGQISDYGQQVRVTPAAHHQPIWGDVETAWEEAAQPLDALLRVLDNILHDLSDLQTPDQEDLEYSIGDLAAISHRLKDLHEHISALIFDLQDNTIYWIELDPRYNNSLSLNFAPLHIGVLMENYLWHTKESVVVTSATLTANNRFDYIRARLNADEADELMLGSPFDYENAALLFLPTDMPEPIDQRNYQRFVERAILQTARATGGRMLALFTSYRQLLETSAVISPLLARDEIQVYEQGSGASTSSLLESFRLSQRAVLLGTRSFWEGVDVPGEALSILMIVKLPFDVPSDPIISARAETFENAFSEYTLPEAILRFRQGFGRLIRTQTDRGVVAILDRRVRSKQYGQYFLQSLPNCHLVESSIEDLPDAAVRWLNL